MSAAVKPLQIKILDPRLGTVWPLPTYATEASAGDLIYGLHWMRQ